VPPADGATYVPDQPEASHRLAGQRPYVEPFHGSTPAGGSAANARLPRRNLSDSGLPGWLAVLLLIGIAGVGGLIDSISGSAVRGVFNYSLVFASLVAILVVRRSQMFNVVIAPPLVYFAASAALLYVRTGGLHNRGKLIDAATNWIVYGFPAIAGATAVVLVVAGIRLMARR
jgi:Gpi18-like mannosyltransferase